MCRRVGHASAALLELACQGDLLGWPRRRGHGADRAPSRRRGSPRLGAPDALGRALSLSAELAWRSLPPLPLPPSLPLSLSPPPPGLEGCPDGSLPTLRDGSPPGRDGCGRLRRDCGRDCAVGGR